MTEFLGNYYYASRLAIKFHRVACGIDTHTIVLHHFPVIMPLPEFQVYPIKVCPQKAPTEDPRHLCYLILCCLLCTPLSISLLVQPSQVACAMISNFYHYVCLLHNLWPPFLLTVPWREHERGIPPHSMYCGRSEKTMLHF